jgi:hypothetical protein
MNKDFAKWPINELKSAVLFLEKSDSAPNLGDLSDCPDWVRASALDYLRHVIAPANCKAVVTTISQVTTCYEVKMRAKILAARADLWEREDWLNGANDPSLNERFGSLNGVPDWVVKAAVCDIRQQIFNLSTGQRRNPLS